jgi:hypothetical protein
MNRAADRHAEAVDDIGLFLADVAELRGVLETQAVGLRDVELAGVHGEFAVARSRDSFDIPSLRAY